MDSFNVYKRNHVGNKKKTRIRPDDVEIIEKGSKKHEFVFAASEAGVLHFDEGFRKLTLAISINGAAALIRFGQRSMSYEAKTPPSSATTVTTRIMDAIHNMAKTPITDDDIRDYCTLSMSFSDGIVQALVAGKLTVCKCPHCDRGQVCVYKQKTEEKFMLTCNMCDAPYNKLEQGRAWLKTLVSALLFKNAVDNVVYTSYSSDNNTVVVDEIAFTDNRNIDQDLSAGVITGTVFVREPLASKIK